MRLLSFKKELYDCILIIIHEMIMIGCSFLRKFDLRLRIAFLSRQNEPFVDLYILWRY